MNLSKSLSKSSCIRHVQSASNIDNVVNSNTKSNDQPRNNRYGFFSKIKNRFFSVFRNKSGQKQLKIRKDADPSPALISIEIENIVENHDKNFSKNQNLISLNKKLHNEEKFSRNDLFINCDDYSLIIGGGR